MKIDVTQEQGRTIVTLQGSIKIKESGYDFFKQLKELYSPDQTDIVLIDMSLIDYIDSTGLGELVGYLHRLKAKGMRMALINPQKTIMSLIKLSNLDKVIPIFPTKEEAFRQLSDAMDSPEELNTLSSESAIEKTIVEGEKFFEKNATSLPSGTEPIPLGSGTIVTLLDSGGMASIYKIWNEKLEVFRAVKILIPNPKNDQRNRFETEAKITAKLHHNNIVEIYNVGDWGGLPYLEMELIDGQSLEAIIRKNTKLPPTVCSAISIFSIRALAYAHEQKFLIYGKTYKGVIHRDLKPANIMISSAGELKLMDFGIARPTETSFHTVGINSTDTNILGTMQYISPEQMDGVDLDNRSDIYSFGAVLYEMLTGTKTFPQENLVELMKQKVLNEYRKFEDFDFAIPPELAKISQKCLQLAKEDRFDNATILLKELEAIHQTLTEESPEQVLKSFITDPSSNACPVKKSTGLYPKLRQFLRRT
jgi:anti-anti-sigma factor